MKIIHLLAASLVLTAIATGGARAQPTFTPITGPTCTGTYMYVLPHLSTENETASSRFISVVMIANLNPSTTATLQACAYNDGAFIGGTSFSLPSNNRVFAEDPPPSGTPPAGQTPVALASMFNTITLPPNTGFHAVIASNIALAVESGFVGPVTGIFTIARAGLAGTVLGTAHFGVLPVYPGTLFISNPNNATVTYSIVFFNDNGTVAAQTGNLTLAPFKRARFEVSALTDANGVSLGLKNYYSLRVNATGGTLGGLTIIRTLAGNYVGNAMAQILP